MVDWSEISSIAISKIFKKFERSNNTNVIIHATQACAIKMTDLHADIEPQENCAIVYAPVPQNVQGACLFLFKKEHALTLCDLVAKRDLGSSTQFEGHDIANYSEIGYVFINTYLDYLFGKEAKAGNAYLPSFGLGVFELIVEQVMAEMSREEQAQALNCPEIIDVVITFVANHKTIKGHLVIILNENCMEIVKQQKNIM
ncbi:MAG: hypothetical protein PHV60_07455 [bacterium]|nr:hypothetical protein [bacterium]